MNRTKLTASAIATLLNELNASTALPWSLADDRLRKSFELADFNAAFGFMTRCALIAEAMDHHPTWHNSYRRVDIELTTHSAGGLTELDFTLARRIDAIAETS